MLIVSVDRLTKKCYSVLSSALPEPKMRSVNRFLPCGSVQEAIFHEISPSSKYFRQMASLPVRWNLTEVLFYLDTGLALSKSDLKSQKQLIWLQSKLSPKQRFRISYFWVQIPRLKDGFFPETVGVPDKKANSEHSLYPYQLSPGGEHSFPSLLLCNMQNSNKMPGPDDMLPENSSKHTAQNSKCIVFQFQLES